MSGQLLVLSVALVGLLVVCQLPVVGPPESASQRTPDTGLGRVPHIGYVWRGPTPAQRGPSMFDVFRDALRQYGWIEGTTLEIDARGVGDQQERLPELIAEMVQRPADVIVVGDSSVAPLVAEATTSIPIVLTLGGNVVVAGQACSVNRPCGNVTGLSLSLAPLSPKRLELLREAAPAVGRAGFMRNAAIPETEHELQVLRDAARLLGVEIVPLDFQHPGDFDTVFEMARAAKIDALMVMPDGVTTRFRPSILAFAREAGLPDIYGVNAFVRDGGLLAYGADREHNYRRAAWYVDQLLRGAKPGNLPIEQPAVFELSLNLQRAAALGLQPSRELTLQATEVITVDGSRWVATPAGR